MQIIQTTTITTSEQKSSKSGGAISVKNLAKQIADEIDILNAADYKKSFLHIRDQAVRAFYSSYYPHYYKRKYSLRYMANSIIEDNEFFIELGIDGPGYFANHRASEDYIYKNSFQLGYHGGARHNGMPTWRTPYPVYSNWGRWASRGPSPYQLIKDGWSNFANGEALSIQDKNENIILAKYASQIESYVINKINMLMAKGG